MLQACGGTIPTVWLEYVYICTYVQFNMNRMYECVVCMHYVLYVPPAKCISE